MLRDLVSSKDGEISVYTFTNRSLPGVLGDPDIQLRVSGRPESSATSHDRMLAAYVTPSTLRCINRRGEVMWHYQFANGPEGYMRSVISQVDLGSTGHGARFVAHPNNPFVLLDVGEVQDGSPLYMFYLDEAESIQL
ncbi:hypothetical protein RJZ90_005664 [Blastomyces dermatitidis]